MTRSASSRSRKSIRRNLPSESAARSSKASKNRNDCPAFGTLCTPLHPLALTMVFRRGGCAPPTIVRVRAAPAMRKESARASYDRAHRSRRGQDKREFSRTRCCAKCGESVEMKEKFFTKYADSLEAMSREMAARFEKGSQALLHPWATAAASLRRAPHDGRDSTTRSSRSGRRFRSFPLMTDTATMTRDWQRPIDFTPASTSGPNWRLLAGPGDMAMVFSTSGKSPNLIYALEAAREKGLMTVAFAGKDGGRFPEYRGLLLSSSRSYSVHRIPGSPRHGRAYRVGPGPYRLGRRRCYLNIPSTPPWSAKWSAC